MTRCTVVVKKPVFRASKLGSLSMNFVPQRLRNITVELSLDGLYLVDEFQIHNTKDVEKADELALD